MLPSLTGKNNSSQAEILKDFIKLRFPKFLFYEEKFISFIAKHIFMKKELEMMPQENLLRYTHPYPIIPLMRRHAKALSPAPPLDTA